MYSVQRILVPVDYSEVSSAAVSAALGIAAANGARVWVLHIQKGLDEKLNERIVTAPNEHVIERGIDADEQALRDLVSLEVHRAAQSGRDYSAVPISVRVSGGDWLGVAVDMVRELELDLIVTGTHGPKGLEGLLLGSVSERLVSKATCSVFVVKPQGYPYLRD
jgi:nucleotide-binding universal stress UspA family protein